MLVLFVVERPEIGLLGTMVLQLVVKVVVVETQIGQQVFEAFKGHNVVAPVLAEELLNVEASVRKQL